MNEILCPLESMARKQPEACAIRETHGRERISYAQLDQLSSQMVQQLEQLSLRAQEPILVAAEPCSSMIALFFACLRKNLVFAPVSLRAPVEQIAAFAQDIGARLMFTDTSYTHVPTNFQHMDTFPSQCIGPVACPLSSLGENDVMGEKHRYTQTFIGLQQHATCIQTSGSSSSPKAAVHFVQSHYYNALGSNQNIALRPGDAWMLSLPLYHVAGIAIVMRCVLAGATIVLPQTDVDFFQRIRFAEASHYSFVHTQLQRLLEDAPSLLQLQKAKAILLGGSAIPETLIESAVRCALPIHVSYGATEMASQITTTPPKASLALLKTSGFPLVYREIRILPSQEIEVCGLTRFAGYLTARGLEQPFLDGWFATGDLGAWNSDGSLRILGRKDAMFISGGENIQPQEIEAALEQHPDILQAIVVDVPDPEFGARPQAFVRSSAKRALSDENLEDFLRSRIAAFKI
ncbi:MAG: o-succinylbenzoate--CoA ligase, partial [Myxococcota bacterium]